METENQQRLIKSNQRYQQLLKFSLITLFLVTAWYVSAQRFQTTDHLQTATALIPVSILCAVLFLAVQIITALANVGSQKRFWNTIQLPTIANGFCAITLAFLAKDFVAAMVPLTTMMISELAGHSMIEMIKGSSFQSVESAEQESFTQIKQADDAPATIAFGLVGQFEENLDDEMEVEEESLESDANCTQKMTRFNTESGEVLSGHARTTFYPGEKTQALHIGFCPPFSQDPTAEIFQVDGTPVLLKPTSVERYGMRFEIKRSDAEQAEDVVVEFFVAESRKSA